jgi:hypothetical protein
MPVRIAGNDTKARPANAALAIEAAVGAGATVIALGNLVDTTRADVARAIKAAVQRDVVVVTGASLGSVPVNPDAKSGPGVLRVGGVGDDGQRVADYRGGGIDAVAPGINVKSTGITGVGTVTGSGTQYAVALVAGTAALVRAAYPDLTAQQVAHRIQVTSDKMSDTAPPDSRYGWGMINPAAAVTKVLPEEAGAGSRSGDRAAKLTSGAAPAGRAPLLALVTLVGLAAAVLLVFRIRRLVREEPGDEDDGDDGGPPPPVAAAADVRDSAPPTVLEPPPWAVPHKPTAESSSPVGHQTGPDAKRSEEPETVVVRASEGSSGPTSLIPQKASIGGKSPQQSAESP